MAASDRSSVLVTGGAGYIGSHCAKVLRQAGHGVTIFDNLSAGHREAALSAPFIQGDIGDVQAVRRALRESRATAVMHFAAWLDVAGSVRDPAGYYRNNVSGTLATLEAMALVGLGYRSLSMPPAAVGPVKAMVRSVEIDALERYLHEQIRSSRRSIRENLLSFARDHGIAV